MLSGFKQFVLRGNVIDLAVAVDAKAVRNHHPRDDRFPEPPARLDHALVRAGDRVLREHHSGRLRVEEHLQ